MSEARSKPVISNMPSQTRSRSGSFSGELTVMQGSEPVGKLGYQFSGSRRTFEVLDIENRKGVSGLGGTMHRHAEAFATDLGARRMTTATSQPGFFKKMGYDYTAAQKELNAARFGATELRDVESKIQTEGSGFLMEKELQRKNNCTIM